MWIVPSCTSDLSAAATALKRERPREFGDLGVSTQAFGLFLFAYSCGSIVGPPIVGLIKAKVHWGQATLALAFTCTAACIPIVSLICSPLRDSNAHRKFWRCSRHLPPLARNIQS